MSPAPPQTKSRKCRAGSWSLAPCSGPSADVDTAGARGEVRRDLGPLSVATVSSVQVIDLLCQEGGQAVTAWVFDMLCRLLWATPVLPLGCAPQSAGCHPWGTPQEVGEVLPIALWSAERE